MEGNWDSYLVDINDQVASVFLDLTLKGIAPDCSRPFLGYIRLRMQDPREDGLSSSEEFKTLIALEKKLLAIIDKRHVAVYVGRITTRSRREFYFYTAKDVELAPAVREALVDYPDYQFDTGSQEDPEWRHYLEVMYPSPVDLELIKNSQVREALAAKNDIHSIPRRISHWCFFRTEAQRDLFNRELPGEGFEVTHTYKMDDEHDEPYVTQFDKVDTADEGIDEAVTVLTELCKKYDGSYDGWETPVITEPNDTEL